MKNNEPFILIFLFLLMMAILPNKNEKKIKTQSPSPSSQTTKAEKNKTTQILVVYEIEYGSIYTGDQTPIVHKGTTAIPIKESFGIGSNGLPISEVGGPNPSLLVFNLSGKKATLYIPTSGQSVIGLLKIAETEILPFMAVKIVRENNSISIHAFPTTVDAYQTQHI